MTLAPPSRPRGARLHLARIAVAATVVVGSLVTGPVAEAADPRSPEARRQEVRERQRTADAQIDVLQASGAELTGALRRLTEDLSARRAVAEETAAAAEAAAADLLRARSAEAESRTEYERLRRNLTELAVDAYIRPSSQVIIPMPDASVLEAARRRRLFDAVVARADTVARDLRAVTEDLERHRQEAEQAAAVAAEQQRSVERELDEVSVALTRQQNLVDEVEGRIEAALAESAALASLDRTLAAEIAQREQELARQAALARQLAAAPTTRTAPATRQAPSTGPRSPAAPTPTAPARPRPGAVGLVTVEGITVAAPLGGPLASLLADARAAGFELGGGGYRDPAAQIATRRANCGDSDYAIWQMPASQCRPPTARPGSSMHEQGLAIDFTWNGALITSRSSPAFQWLAANAGSYGLRNLPSEPWHWSTNGR